MCIYAIVAFKEESMEMMRHLTSLTLSELPFLVTQMYVVVIELKVFCVLFNEDEETINVVIKWEILETLLINTSSCSSSAGSFPGLLETKTGTCTCTLPPSSEALFELKFRQKLV